ncbi:monovalent cation:H+ antiporter, CPA1 (nhx1) [Cladochytrium tenue]|nr:monovalent cation:H+ antiporter, CPA1 (nhx1) [Cladochytrium tenue]
MEFSLLDCMIFGAVLSSTDPVTIIAIFHQMKVDPKLFAIIFGESILNDSVAIIIVLIARYASTVPLAQAVNVVSRQINPARTEEMIPKNYQLMMWWAGLRGAVAFALSFDVPGPSAPAVRTTTLVVCVVSVIVLGGTTNYALELLKIRTGVGAKHAHHFDGGDDGAENASNKGDDTDSSDDEDDDDVTEFVEQGRPGRNLSGGPVRLRSGDYSDSPSGLRNDDDWDGFTRRDIDMAHWFISFDNQWLKPLFTRNQRFGGSSGGTATAGRRRYQGVSSAADRASLLRSVGGSSRDDAGGAGGAGGGNTVSSATLAMPPRFARKLSDDNVGHQTGPTSPTAVSAGSKRGFGRANQAGEPTVSYQQQQGVGGGGSAAGGLWWNNSAGDGDEDARRRAVWSSSSTGRTTPTTTFSSFATGVGHAVSSITQLASGMGGGSEADENFVGLDGRTWARSGRVGGGNSAGRKGTGGVELSGLGN